MRHSRTPPAPMPTGHEALEGVSCTAPSGAAWPGAAQPACDPPPDARTGDAAPRALSDRDFEELKVRVHRELLDRLDLAALAALDRDQAELQLRAAVERLADQHPAPLGRFDRERLIAEVACEVVGLGPLDPLLADPSVTAVFVNGPFAVYVERFGKLDKAAVCFRDADHLQQIVIRLRRRAGTLADGPGQTIEARLPDGAQLTAVLPPLALDGPLLSIRRPVGEPYTMGDLLNLRSLTVELAALLRATVRARLNVLVYGPVAAGKTTLLNCLAACIPDGERIVTIEDIPELHLCQPHVLRLTTRAAATGGEAAAASPGILRQALRLRPDRIVVGDLGEAEAAGLLEAIQGGHTGTLAAITASGPRACLQRLESLVAMAGVRLPPRGIRQHIAQALDAIIEVRRLADGTRKVVRVSELAGLEGNTVLLQDIAEFVQTGTSTSSIVEGYFRLTGVRPRFLGCLIGAGEPLEGLRFEPRRLA